MQEEPESATANNSFHDDSATLREETMNKNALAATKDLFGTDCHSNEPQRQAFTFNNCKFAYSVPNTSHDLVVGMMQTKKPFNGRITVTGSEAGNRLSIFCLFDDGQEFDPEFSPGHELSISHLSISCIDGDSGTKRLSETAAKKKAKDDVLTSSIFGSDWIDDESSDIATHSEEDALSSFLEQPFSSIQRRETLPASPLKPKPMPMSFRLTEAMLKKRHHELDIINAELAELSKILGSKREQLRRKENALKEKEKRLAEAQERMNLDIRETLRQKTEERDNFLKREVEAIILESDTSVACLGKENRRLVISNKELSAANRKLRDQVRTMTQAISERDARESELHNQLKQQKDRIDRLRKAASDVKPAKLVIERLARSSHATDVHHPKARMTDAIAQAGTQTLSGGPIIVVNTDPKQSFARFEKELSDLVFALLRSYYILSDSDKLKNRNQHQEFVLNAEEQLYKPLVQGIPVLHKLSCESRQSSVGLYSLFLTFVLEFVRELPSRSKEVKNQKFPVFLTYVHSFKRASLADAAWNVLSRSPDATMHLHAKVCLMLLTLGSIARSAIARCEKTLMDLMALLSNYDEVKLTFVTVGAVDIIHPFLALDVPGTSCKALASSLILTMCADGDWQNEFLTQCTESDTLMDSLLACCGPDANSSDDNIGVCENALVLLQKLSGLELSVVNNTNFSNFPRAARHGNSIIRENSQLFARLQELARSDLEFIKLNAVSILQNLQY
ncbi:hypothetical protein HDU82_005422 [Entophlyctis luteolus]|nr:hypothetical protein HDU82_005422 [Entophlyctis luteolus]